MQQKQSCPPYSSVPVHVGCEKRQEGTSTAHTHIPLSTLGVICIMEEHQLIGRLCVSIQTTIGRPIVAQPLSNAVHTPGKTESGPWRIFTAGYLIENIHQKRLNNKRTDLRGLQLSRCDYRDLELSYPSDGYTKTSNMRLILNAYGDRPIDNWVMGTVRDWQTREEKEKKNRGGCLWDVATAHPSRDGWAKGKNFNQRPKRRRSKKNKTKKY